MMPENAEPQAELKEAKAQLSNLDSAQARTEAGSFKGFKGSFKGVYMGFYIRGPSWGSFRVERVLGFKV